MNVLDRARITRLFFKLVQNPGRTDLIFKAIEIVSKHRTEPLAVKILERIYSDEKFANLYRQKYVGELPSLEELSQYPEKSFGRLYYHHMHENGLRPELFPKFDPANDFDYLNLRMYQDHDLWHTLLGYGISVEDELAVQAFSVAQLQSPVSALLITGGLLHLLKSEPLRAVTALKGVAEGYERGKRAQFLLGLRLNEMLEKPIDEVRSLCRVA